MRFLLLCLFALPVSAQSALPDAPVPHKDEIKPFALNFTSAERLHCSPTNGCAFETTLGGGADYRFPGNMERVGAFYSFAPATNTSSMTITFTVKLWEAGKRR